MDEPVPVREAYQRVQEAMLRACARRRRAPESVRLLAATKTVAPERIRELYACGCRLFGENRVQERQAKLEALRDLTNVSWHLLGPLQQNKAARALALFDCIESVDTLALAQRLNRLVEAARRGHEPSDRLPPPIEARPHATSAGVPGAQRRGGNGRDPAKSGGPPPHPVPVLIEVNIGREPQKHGVWPEAALELGLAIHAMAGLTLSGLMTVPPLTPTPEGARPYFAALAELSERLRQALGRPVGAWELSMGMSHDYEVAIEEGANLVRLGTALFGAR